MPGGSELRVAVIGAGASGLAAIKCCLDEGLQPICFEKSDGIGGLWRFTPEVEPGRAGVYRSTTINSSKELLAYSTFPPPPEFPNFMHHSKLYQYLKLFEEKYNLGDFIQLKTEVLKVERASSPRNDGSWIVTTQSSSGSKKEKSETVLVNAVMVCTGHHAFPNNPSSKIPGFKDFTGQVFHGHDYKDYRPFENRRVMIVGLGNTGGDLAAELSRHGSKVLLSTRRGAWIINRIGDNGIPFDCTVSRCVNYLMDILPASLLNWFYERKMNGRFDHALYGLKPKHRILGQHPLVNDELPARIANGSLKVVPDIAKFSDGGVTTADGVFHQVDDVIFATGYVIKFPFLPEDVVSVNEDNVLSPLYKHVFPLSQSRNADIAIIGNVQPLGGLMPIAEMQSRWACKIFRRTAKLPTIEIMKEEVAERNSKLSKRYIRSSRHTIQVDYVRYMDAVAEEIGVVPNLTKLFVNDPVLAWRVLTGPATSYQYRLHGPGAWSGAEDAIGTQWRRIKAGFGHKMEASTTDKSSAEMFKLVSLLFITVVLLSSLFI